MLENQIRKDFLYCLNLIKTKLGTPNRGIYRLESCQSAFKTETGCFQTVNYSFSAMFGFFNRKIRFVPEPEISGTFL